MHLHTELLKYRMLGFNQDAYGICTHGLLSYLECMIVISTNVYCENKEIKYKMHNLDPISKSFKTKPTQLFVGEKNHEMWVRVSDLGLHTTSKYNLSTQPPHTHTYFKHILFILGTLQFQVLLIRPMM